MLISRKLCSFLVISLSLSLKSHFPILLLLLLPQRRKTFCSDQLRFKQIVQITATIWTNFHNNKLIRRFKTPGMRHEIALCKEGSIADDQLTNSFACRGNQAPQPLLMSCVRNIGEYIEFCIYIYYIETYF